MRRKVYGLRSRDLETRYHEQVRRQRKALEEYAAHEIEFADDLLLWYKIKKLDMPDDEYRAVAFLKTVSIYVSRGL